MFVKATYLLSELQVCNFSELIENERLQGSLFAMNVHSCHLTKGKGEGRKGKHNTHNSYLTSLVVYAVDYILFFIYI